MLDAPLATPGAPPPLPVHQDPAPAQVALCRTAGALSTIRHPNVTLALWRRRLPAKLAERIDQWPDADWPSLRLSTTPDRVARDVIAAAPLIAGPLIADIARLARVYADIVGCPSLVLRLERVTGDGCKYFHVDYVGVRLLCAYRGAGTQWAPEDAVRRDGLGLGDNRAVLPDARRARSLRTGHVGLLKGEAWPGNRGRGLVHRSPPATPGSPRLLLCIDHDAH